LSLTSSEFWCASPMKRVDAREDAMFVDAHVELLQERGHRARAARLFPILQWLPAYEWHNNLPSDVASGVTIGCVLMAQSIAHAQLSGVSLVHGPYSCVVPPVMYMLLGTSRHGSVGTGGLVALLTGAEMARYETEAERTQAAMVLAFLVGIIMITMGSLRLASLVRFMSRPALSGFVTGSALLIVESQLPGALGYHGAKFLPLMWSIVTGEKPVHMPTVALSVCILATLLSFKRLAKVLSVVKALTEFKEIIVMSLSTIFCLIFGASLGIELIGALPTGLPMPTLPAMSQGLINELLPGAFLLSLIVFISSYAAAKKIAMLEGYQIDPTSELLGLGIANAAGACVGAIPTQIGLSRTGIAYASGAKSQIGTGLVTASVIMLSLMLLTPLFYFMPRCVLNCVIIAAAKGLVDFDEPLWLYNLPVNWRDLKDLVVWAIAFVVTLFCGAFQGMLWATVLSMFLLVLEVTEPNLSVLALEEDKWQSCTDLAGSQDGDFLVARVDGILFFANVERFQEQIESVMHARMRRKGETIKYVVLDFSCVPFLDATVVEVLREMVQAWQRQGTELRIANSHGRARRVLEKELGSDIGQGNFRISAQEALCEMKSHQHSGSGGYVPPGCV